MQAYSSLERCRFSLKPTRSPGALVTVSRVRESRIYKKGPPAGHAGVCVDGFFNLVNKGVHWSSHIGLRAPSRRSRSSPTCSPNSSLDRSYGPRTLSGGPNWNPQQPPQAVVVVLGNRRAEPAMINVKVENPLTAWPMPGSNGSVVPPCAPIARRHPKRSQTGSTALGRVGWAGWATRRLAPIAKGKAHSAKPVAPVRSIAQNS